MEGVRLVRRHVVMTEYSQAPLNPHPVFPQWSPWSVYPYQYYGSVRKYLARRRYYMPTLENDFLRVEIAPDLGGRIWDVYDKIGKRHVINFNPEVHIYNAGFGLNYVCAGIECNYPLAHACTTSRKREVSDRRNPDGSASIVISEYERIWRTRWSVTYTLYPGRSLVELRVRIYNRTPFDSRCMYWNNCGFYLTPNTQFIFPEVAGAMHGMENRTFSWPIWQHRDLSIWKNTPPEMLGLYMLDAREPFFGYYNHDEGHGLVHYGDLADLPGKKSWTWGTDPGQCDMLRKTHHSLGKVYGEVQSGRIVIQEHLDRVPPETEFEWSEIWYPVRGTGAFNGAGPGAALRAEVVESSARTSTLKIVAMANGSFPQARVRVASDGLAPVEKDFPLDATKTSEIMVRLPGRAGPDQHTEVMVQDASGLILARARLRHPSRRDSWREVVDLTRPLKAVGVEELFQAAEKEARDWGNHDLKPLYEKVLALDPDYSPARRELGKLCIWRGEYAAAVEHLAAARRRDEDSLENRYFHGLALLLSGNVEEARKAFELANRYDCEARSLVRLAELRMRERDWAHALRHLDRLAESRPRLTRPRGLRAACLRKLGRMREAAGEIASALAIDGQDPFLRFEDLFVRLGLPDRGGLPKRELGPILSLVREEEPPLLEAAFDYLAAGLFEETLAVTRAIPRPGPLARLAMAWSLHRLGRAAEARRALQAALGADVTGHQIWRLEMFDILAWARETFPKHARPLYLLGNLLMARRRTEEGRRMWEEAARRGERHWLLFANLGYYHSRVAKDYAAALEWFRKAERANPDDLYVICEIAAALNAVEGPRAVVRYLERRQDAVRASPRVAHALLSAYLKLSMYDRFDDVCSRLDFRHNFQIPGPHQLWWPRHFQEAAQLIEKGEPERALRILEGLSVPPPHLGIFDPRTVEDDRRLYHMGRCYEKMGRHEEARACWEKALQVPHFTGYEHAYWFREWSRRYFQALSLQKLGRESEANAYFDALELLVHTGELPVAAQDQIMDMVERGRFAPENQKDPLVAEQIAIATRAEE